MRRSRMNVQSPDAPWEETIFLEWTTGLMMVQSWAEKLMRRSEKYLNRTWNDRYSQV
jgi:hypothetical protein